MTVLGLSCVPMYRLGIHLGLAIDESEDSAIHCLT